jgi:VanZ family protein
MDRSALQRRRRQVLTVYVIVLLALTLTPGPSLLTHPPAGLDKVAHFLMFAGLAVLIYWNVPAAPGPSPAPMSIIAASALAGLIELLQAAVPNRTEDVRDFIAGVVGALVGAGVASLVARLGRSIGSGTRPEGREP